MNEKRYFKRMWEGEYYIFDSQTISEKEFDEKVQYEDYRAFEDCMHGDDVVNRMNELNDENKELRGKSSSWKITASEEIAEKTELVKENVKLKQKNRELEELVSEVDNELEIRDIVCGAGKFRLEEWGKHRYHQFYKGDEELEDEAVVIMLMEYEKENKELKRENDLLSDELEQAKAVINKKWSEYLKKKELS